MTKIGIFDSGVGGFSILKELMNTPHEYFYLADQEFFPYGNKSAGDLEERLTIIGSWFQRLKPDLLVVACNTATVNGISLLRKNLICPIVGVEPIVKPAANYPKALILGTEPTLNSPRMKELILSHPGSIMVFCPVGLAQAVENINMEQVKTIIHKIKSVVLNENIQAIGLSCTHYPLIKDLLQEYLPEIVFLDPSTAVVKHALRILESKNLAKIENRDRKIRFYTTGDMLRFNYQIKHYLGIKTESQKVKL